MGKRNSGDRWEEKSNDFPLDRTYDPWRRGVVGEREGGRGKYTSNDPGLTGKPSDTLRDAPSWPGKDIFDAVEGQSSDSGNRAVRSGRL
jgi:hypothetical protein